MADPYFEPDSRGLRELLFSSQLYPALEAQAAPIEARAKANAAPHYRTGDYERSIRTERERGHDRVRVRVVSDDRVAPILEAWYHIFSRAVG